MGGSRQSLKARTAVSKILISVYPPPTDPPCPELKRKRSRAREIVHQVDRLALQALGIHVKEERRSGSDLHMCSIDACIHTSHTDVDDDYEDDDDDENDDNDDDDW